MSNARFCDRVEKPAPGWGRDRGRKEGRNGKRGGAGGRASGINVRDDERGGFWTPGFWVRLCALLARCISRRVYFQPEHIFPNNLFFTSSFFFFFVDSVVVFIPNIKDSSHCLDNVFYR